MEIRFDAVTKKFARQVIVKDASFRVSEGSKTAVTGHNGSGKSTLLKLIYRSTLPSGGSIHYRQSGEELAADKVPFRSTLTGPYSELIEELEAEEFLEFYQRFRAYKKGWNPQNILAYCYLDKEGAKPIKDFSSGMKQRLKLAHALFSESELVMLDEPTANLDRQGVEWYKKLVNDHLEGRTFIVASNSQKEETFNCEGEIRIEDFKPA